MSRAGPEPRGDPDLPYRTFFDAVDEGCCIIRMIFDDHGKPVDYLFLEVNAAFERQTGLVDAPGRRMRELAPGHEEHWFEIYGRIALTGESARFEQEAARLHRWYDVFAFRFGDPANREVAVLFHDTTARKLAETQMRQTKAQLRVAMRLGKLGSWTVALPDMRISWSQEARAIHGLPPGQPTTPEEVLSLVEPGYRSSLEEALCACMDRGSAFDLEIRARTAAGRPIWTRVIGEAVRDAAGTVTSVQGAVQDITEVKEAALHAAQLGERLRLTFESGIDAFFTLDREWRFTYVNQQAYRLLGRAGDDLLGKVVWEEYPEALGSPFHREYERALCEQVATETEAFFTPLARWFKVSAHPSPEGLAVYFRDVTEEHRARAELADREEHYRMLFEHSMDAILCTCADRRIVRANPAACALFGVDEGQLLGRDLSGMFDPRDDRVEALLACLRRDGAARGELTLVRADGSRLEAELSTAKHRDSSGDLHTFVVMRDVTERIRTRQALLELNAELTDRVKQRTAELEDANADLKAFAHALAHDLRGPIAAIGGFTEMLGRSLAEGKAARVEHYLARIRAAARTMEDYTSGLLAMAQLTQARLLLQDRDLTAMARDVMAILHEQSPERQVECLIQEGLRARCDGTLLRMALENLLGNAWKFTSRRAVARIEFTCATSPGGHAVYCVRDNGAGFDMAFAGKLFGSFQRLHTQAEFPGTGIGLANVQRIIHRHGGRIWAESCEGEGASFFFTLWDSPDRGAAPAGASGAARSAAT